MLNADNSSPALQGGLSPTDDDLAIGVNHSASALPVAQPTNDTTTWASSPAPDSVEDQFAPNDDISTPHSPRRINEVVRFDQELRFAGTADVAAADDTADTHPLASSVSLGSSTIQDELVTRPSLKRHLMNEPASEVPENEIDDNIPPSARQGQEEETIVIVHEVSRTDSLAGVALRYGIRLSDLRRVNHLWTSDTIHLRQLLYIPLQLSSKRHLYQVDGQHAVDGPASLSSTCEVHSDPVIIERIRSSQLAFFPPSSYQHTPSPGIGLPSTSLPSPDPAIPYSRLSNPRIPHTSLSTSSTYTFPGFVHNLSSLARENNLFTRLSLDSVDSFSSTNTSTNISTTSSEEDHEMDVLNGNVGKSLRYKEHRDRTPTQTRFARASFEESSMRTTTKSSVICSAISLGPSERAIPMSVLLQTEQPKPSSPMEFPNR